MIEFTIEVGDDYLKPIEKHDAKVLLVYLLWKADRPVSTDDLAEMSPSLSSAIRRDHRG